MIPEPVMPMVSSDDAVENIPEQDGLQGIGPGRQSELGAIVFEDYFPKLDLKPEEEEQIIQWFERDLRCCIRCVNKEKSKWATYRAVYMMEYVEKFYPDTGLGANYSSGLLCEKMLEGMDRMRRAVFQANPLFAPDTKLTGDESDVGFLHRAQWALQTVLVEQMKVKKEIRYETIFEFLLDGSAILEADTLFEKVPQRTIKTYSSLEELEADADKVIDQSRLEKAYLDIQQYGVARILVEEDVVTENGLQVFHVSKTDHLVPEGVYSDKNIKFRGRRMYLTGADLRVLASEDVNWYEKEKVDKVLNERETKRMLRSQTGDAARNAMERLAEMEGNKDLCYPYEEDDQQLTTTPGTQPYEDVYSVYRVTCKYGYRTKSDPDGVIPKYCLIDYSPEGRSILRSVTYPHFSEHPNWFHLKLGFAPNSYWGYGYGARLVQDDFLESNAVDLFLEAAALTTFAPMLCKHPDVGGMYPWASGYGPGKIGYVNDINDFQQLEPKPPNMALLRVLLPLIQSRSANRTSVTSLTQGQPESTDPRSPAAKTAMLLQESNIGLDIMVGDWNNSGWDDFAAFVWRAMYEIATYVLGEGRDIGAALRGVVVLDESGLTPESENKITLQELKRDIIWVSQASVAVLNPELRTERFLKLFQFFVPMLREIAQFNPDAFKTYFLRWMQRAAQEVDLPGISYLIPTLKDIQNIPAERLMGSLDTLMRSVRSGQAPGTVELGQPTGQMPPQEQEE